MKKVSVIMPNYNHAPYLKERLDSIFAQDYPWMEVILLDDASTDESAAILARYATRKEVTHILMSKTNSGNTFVQWEKGLKRATGDYIWIAESDDVADSTFLSRMVEALEREEAVVAFCRSRKIDSDGNILPQTCDPRWKRDFSMDGKTFVRQFLLGYTTICNASAVLFRRDQAARIDLSYISRYHASGDRLFWIEMALQGRVAYVAQPLNRFRQHLQKVSGPAESKGLNIVQDYAIYQYITQRIALSRHDKRLVCGYHWQAMHRPTVSTEGREKAMRTWQQEPLFGKLSYWAYMAHRLREKCGLI